MSDTTPTLTVNLSLREARIILAVLSGERGDNRPSEVQADLRRSVANIRRVLTGAIGDVCSICCDSPCSCERF